MMRLSRVSRLVAATAALLLSGCGDFFGTDDVFEVTVMETRVPCSGLWGQAESCLLIQWEADEEPEAFLGEIEGFTFEFGVRQRIRVERDFVRYPPADGSSYRYRLVEVISRLMLVPSPTPTPMPIPMPIPIG
jgi:hypothetical protein